MVTDNKSNESMRLFNSFQPVATPSYPTINLVCKVIQNHQLWYSLKCVTYCQSLPMSYTMCVTNLGTFSQNWVDNPWWHPIIEVGQLIIRAINFEKSRPSSSNKEKQGNKHIFSYILDNQQLHQRCHLTAPPFRTQITSVNYQVLLHGLINWFISHDGVHMRCRSIFLQYIFEMLM